MKCEKCKKDFSEHIWENGKTYKGIDEHHNPPQFLMENWKGKTYNLCRKCHRNLHDLIIDMMNKKANTLKFIKSEYWVMQKLTPKQKKELCEEVYNFTELWIREDEHGNNTS